MCLNTITERRPRNRDVVVAYKSLIRTESGQFMSPVYASTFVLDEWKKASTARSVSNGIRFYDHVKEKWTNYGAGFHAFKSKKVAQGYRSERSNRIVVKVELRDVRTVGMDGRGSKSRATTYVAKEMRIVKVF